MKIHNFRTIMVISIILLLCASFAQARLRAITEEDLAQVTAESGITIGMDVTVRVTAGLDDGSLWLMQDSSQKEGIRWSDFMVGAADINNGFPLSGDVTMDVGSSGTRTWLNVSGLVMPGADNELRVRLNNTYVYNDRNNDTFSPSNVTDIYTISDTIYLYGLNIGRNTTKNWYGDNIYLQPPSAAPPFVKISNNGNSGIEIQSEMAVFLDALTWRYTDGSAGNVEANRFQLNDVYVYGHTNFDPLMRGNYIDNPDDAEYSGDPGNWNNGSATGATPTYQFPGNDGKLYGNAKIGGYIPTYTYDTSNYDATVNGYSYFPATIDVGSSGTTTLLRMNLPMAMSMKIARMEMGIGGNTTDYINLGSHSVDNAAFYKVQMTLRNTY